MEAVPDPAPETEMTAVYHERQQLYRCGLHALNNALQGPVISRKALDAACERLARAEGAPGGGWWNPHRSPLGLGNYDVNALMLALDDRGFCMQWLDKRKRVTRELVDLDRVVGVLCNVVLADSLLHSLWEQRHWFAVRKINGVVYNLDSKLDAPMPFPSDDACYDFLQQLADTGECELFIISAVKS